MKNYWEIALMGVVLIIGIIFFYNKKKDFLSEKQGNTTLDKNKEKENTPVLISCDTYPIDISIPDSLNFCGESVDLTNPDVIERLDEELLKNAFWHSSTILIIKKMHRWFPVIEKILKEEKIPDDFKYLMVIESNISNAVSPRGATGFWQLMKGTAKEYGLIVNSEVDERYNPIKSTRAACKYLKKAYSKFNNWTLVAASYNMGMRGLSRVLERQNGKTYYDLSLNRETSRYVFRILAFKEILKNPSEFNFSISKENVYQPLQTKKIKVTESIKDLAEFAKENDVSYRTLKYYNPWLRENSLTVKSNNSYEILFPANTILDL